MGPTDKHIVKQIKELKPNISGQLDQRTIDDCFAVMDNQKSSARTVQPNPWRLIMKNKIAPAAIAASILLVVGLLVWPTNPNNKLSSFALLTQAHAAEQTVFSGQGIVYLVNEFTLFPVAKDKKFSNRLKDLESSLAKNELENLNTKNLETLKAWFSFSWLPFYSIGADGQMKCNQMEPAANNSCVVTEKIWHESATGRFIRIMEADGKVIFANSFDGQNVCSSYDNAGVLSIRKEPAAADFEVPQNPVDFLGMGAGITVAFSRKEDYPPIINVSEETMNQTQVRVYKMGFKDLEGCAETYYLFKVGMEDNIIQEIQCVVEGQPSMILKRISAQSIPQPALSWNLKEIDDKKTAAAATPVVIRSDIFSANISVDQMVRTADFETYIFSINPAWTSEGQISSGPDEGSSTSLMFNIVYQARDGRHVILSQMPSLTRYHTGIFKKLEEIGQPFAASYNSPLGYAMYHTGKSEKWWTEFSIKASGFEPAENRCGVIIRTPAGTYLALAVNGPVSEDEFQKLVDSLVPAREYQKH
jgi:hypothetical protein